MNKSALSIYVHLPFCESRCGYCDFNTFAGCEYLIPEYIDALVCEIENFQPKSNLKEKVHSIYFGGGTPSLMPVSMLQRILHAILSKFFVKNDVEISIEINPSCIALAYLEGLTGLGINRLSIGMQSADHDELKLLDRNHTFNDVQETFERAKNAGFSNISLDLIYGIPKQTLSTFQQSLLSAIQLEPEHLSLYALTLHEGTPMQTKITQGEYPPLDDDLSAEMYEFAMEFLQESGYQQYEISNWGKEERFFCTHNLQYWKNKEYIGFGAGAHSHYDNKRWEDERTIPGYIKKANISKNTYPFTNYSFDLSQDDEIQETMIMGLRLTTAGLAFADFQNRFGVRMEEIYGPEIKRLSEMGLLEIVGEGNQAHVRLTPRARIIGNQVFEKFIRI